MENRITSLLLPIFLVGIAFIVITQMNKSDRPKTNGEHSATTRVDQHFEPDELFKIVNQVGPDQRPPFLTGSAGPRAVEGQDPGYRIVTSSIGGTIRSVDALDYYTKPGLSDAEKVEHQLPLIEDLEKGVYSFAIEDFLKRFPLVKETPDQDRFIGEVYWQATNELGDKGIRYRLELANSKGKRLTFEKDFYFLEGRRHVKLVVRIKTPSGNESFDTSVFNKFHYYLRGPMVMRIDKNGPSFTTPPRAFAVVKSTEGTRVAQLASTKKPEETPRQVLTVEPTETFQLAGAGNRFFACILAPENPVTALAVQGVKAMSVPRVPDSATPEQIENGYKTITPLLQIAQDMPKPGETSEIAFQIYIGPKDRRLFSTQPEYSDYLAVSDLDLQSPCFCAFGSVPLAKVMLGVLEMFESFLGNWGLSIILLTLLVRALMMPLNLRQARTMRAYQDKMTKLKPEMDAIRAKYKNNQKKLNQSMMEFQKKHKVFPPLLGCLPLFLTMPVFLGLFTMLRASFPLRHQPFVGWINDLSQPDRLAALGLPYVPYLNLLPLLMLTLWIINAFRTPLSDDPQQKQQQRMMRWMPMVFGVMLYGYASGLALYMTASAIWSLVEQRVVRKKVGKVAGMPTTF